MIDRQQNLERTNLKLREGTDEVRHFSRYLQMRYIYILRLIRIILRLYWLIRMIHYLDYLIGDWHVWLSRWNNDCRSSPIQKTDIDHCSPSGHHLTLCVGHVYIVHNTYIVWYSGGTIWGCMRQQRCWSTGASYQRRKGMLNYRFHHYDADADA